MLTSRACRLTSICPSFVTSQNVPTANLNAQLRELLARIEDNAGYITPNFIEFMYRFMEIRKLVNEWGTDGGYVLEIEDFAEVSDHKMVFPCIE